MDALKNNSEIMKTIVETFLIEEVTSLIYDNEQLNKWGNLVNELGLKGQVNLKAQDKSPIPFMALNVGTMNIFEVLCPRKVDVKEFNITPIPVEILDLIALSIRENYFHEIQIWYDDKDKDPACIGVTGMFVPVDIEYNWFYNDKVKSSKEALEFLVSKGLKPYNEEGGYWTDETFYLIGKWADVRHSIDELKEMAIARYCAVKKNECEKTIRDAQRELEDLKSKSFELFN